MKVKIKRLCSNAVIPKYSKVGDAGMDLYCTKTTVEKEGNGDLNLVCHTGIAMEIPQGYVGLIFPRSSISKTNLWLRNAVGVIDSGYRGEIICKFGYYKGLMSKEFLYSVGDRVAQIMILPHPSIQFEEVEELSDSERGQGGFGSTGL